MTAVIDKTKPLAILGGEPLRTKKFPAHKTIGTEEKLAVERVLNSGVLSRFLGTWHEDFYGGPEVNALEKEWAHYFGVKHAITVNSATSALYAAVGAVGIEPGDEVIVSPYTMSASAVAPLVYNAIPVFADIEPDHFCLDVHSVESKITERTKAIVVVDIFGLPYDRDGINALAKKHGIAVIEDCAQAPGVYYKDKMAGTLGDIGIYSLNYHKHIHSGEGGVLVTNDDALAEKLQLIRNHAESVVAGKGVTDLTNMVGFNYRMTELEAAITREQLKKLKPLLAERQNNAAEMDRRLSEIPCLNAVPVREGCTHGYYQQPMLYDANAADGIHRDVFINAVKAELPVTELRETEGVKIGYGYVKPIYWQPMFEQRIAYGSQGHPWTTFKSDVTYPRGLCPVTERLHTDTLIHHEMMRPLMTPEDRDDVVAAFHKVWAHRHLLQQ